MRVEEMVGTCAAHIEQQIMLWKKLTSEATDQVPLGFDFEAAVFRALGYERERPILCGHINLEREDD